MNVWIETIRFVLAVIIVIYHCSFIVINRRLSEGRFLFEGGSCAVEFFFLLSGFLMARSIARNKDIAVDLGDETFRFVCRKAIRILPFSLISSFIILSCGVILNGATFISTLQKFWTCIPELCFVQQCGLAAGTINGHMWYVSAMLISVFVLYPFARKWPSVFNSTVAPIIAFTIIGVLYQVNHGLGRPAFWNGFMMNGLARGFGEISAGCFCFYLTSRLSKSGIRVMIVNIAVLCSSAVFLLWLWRPFGGTAFHLIFPSAVIIMGCFSGHILSTPSCLGALGAFLGELSLPIYINQYWVINIVKNFNQQVVDFHGYLICVVETVLLVFAFSSVELLAYKLLNKKFGTRRR